MRSKQRPRVKRSLAFTLVELLIVVAIIAILAAIVVPNFLEAQVRAKVSREKHDLRTIATGLEAYYVDHSEYPAHGEIRFPGGVQQEPVFPAERAGLGTVEFVALNLTSPVAYLSSYPLDPFLTREDPFQMQSYGYIQSSQMTNILLANPFLPPSVHEDAALLTEKHGGWRLYAAGPDTDKGDAKTSIVYDPSNGTVSDGDIVRSQLRPDDRRHVD